MKKQPWDEGVSIKMWAPVCDKKSAVASGSASGISCTKNISFHFMANTVAQLL